MNLVPLRRRIRGAGRRYRHVRMLVRAFRHRYHPVAAHVIPTRRCNLACAYCNEYDGHSPPVPVAEVRRRVDHLARLGTGIVTLSGGEPLLHPDLDEIIRHIRGHAMIATLITNGCLLTRDRIVRLNRAGLDHLQVSVDNVVPDDVTKKSLKVLDQKLRWLSELAEFDVTVNTVVGSGLRRPDEALAIVQRARSLGFSTTVGIVHDGHGRMVDLDERQRSVLEDVVAAGGSTFDFANYNRFQKNLANGQPNDWHCGAGSRHVYVCEDGLVHWCSQQRGRPGIPIERYGFDDLRRQYHVVKECAPWCTVGCVHRVAQVDELREDPELALSRWFSPAVRGDRAGLPPAVRLLLWAFVTNPRRELFRRAAVRVFRAGLPAGIGSRAVEERADGGSRYRVRHGAADE